MLFTLTRLKIRTKHKPDATETEGAVIIVQRAPMVTVQPFKLRAHIGHWNGHWSILSLNTVEPAYNDHFWPVPWVVVISRFEYRNTLKTVEPAYDDYFWPIPWMVVISRFDWIGLFWLDTVKPAYNDHPRDRLNDRYRQLVAVEKLIIEKKRVSLGWSLWAAGIYREMVAMAG